MKLKVLMAALAIGGLTAVGMHSCKKAESDVKQKPAAVNCANYNDKAATEGTINPCSEPVEYPLYAGNPKNNPEDKLIGKIRVFRDENYLYVQYSVDKPGWTLHLTHTYVGPCAEVPSNNGGAIPGQFDKTPWGIASEQAECGVTCWVEKFPISKFANLECVCILTHAEAWNECKPAETAWGGNSEFPGNNWGRYVSCFQIPDCGETN